MQNAACHTTKVVCLARQTPAPFKGSRRAPRCSATSAPEHAPTPAVSLDTGDAPNRRNMLGGLCVAACTALVLPASVEADTSQKQLNIMRRRGEVAHSEEEWRRLLTPGQFGILREAGTELPLKSPLNREKRTGTFCCAGCGAALYDSKAKFDSGTGWPSFTAALPGAVDLVPDPSIPFYPRTEVRCHRCQGHLGHVFDDGPPPTYQRFCMNGNAMAFKPADA